MCAASSKGSQKYFSFQNVRFGCPYCDGLMEGARECPKCHQIDYDLVTFGSLQEKFLDSMTEVLDSGRIRKNLPVLQEYLNLLSQRAALPVVSFNNAQEIVKLCFGLQGNLVKGNFKESD